MNPTVISGRRRHDPGTHNRQRLRKAEPEPLRPYRRRWRLWVPSSAFFRPPRNDGWLKFITASRWRPIRMDTPLRRVLVKLSGEAFIAPDGYWLHPQTLSSLAGDIAKASEAGFEIALVVGGGNIIRGARMSAAGWIDRATADSMGMLATVMNSLALETALNAAGVDARTMSAVSMPTICETYARQPALHHLDKGQIVVLAGGTGNPFFTTDTSAVLRAAELRCDAVLKATQVDGVYSSDPKTD